VNCNNILIYIQQDATLHSLFYLKTPLNVSGRTITNHQEHKQLYLQHHEIHTLIGLMLRNFRTEFHENTTLFQTSSLKFAQIEKQISKDRPAHFINLLKPTFYVMRHQFNIQQLYTLLTLYLCVLYLSESKKRLVPFTP